MFKKEMFKKCSGNHRLRNIWKIAIDLFGCNVTAARVNFV